MFIIGRQGDDGDRYITDLALFYADGEYMHTSLLGEYYTAFGGVSIDLFANSNHVFGIPIAGKGKGLGLISDEKWEVLKNLAKNGNSIYVDSSSETEPALVIEEKTAAKVSVSMQTSTNSSYDNRYDISADGDGFTVSTQINAHSGNMRDIAKYDYASDCWDMKLKGESYSKKSITPKTTGFTKLYFTIERYGHFGVIGFQGNIDPGSYGSSVPVTVIPDSDLEGFIPAYLTNVIPQCQTNKGSGFGYNKGRGLWYYGKVDEGNTWCSMRVPVIFAD